MRRVGSRGPGTWASVLVSPVFIFLQFSWNVAGLPASVISSSVCEALNHTLDLPAGPQLQQPQEHR